MANNETRQLEWGRFHALQLENARLERKVAGLVEHLARKEEPLTDVCVKYEAEIARLHGQIAQMKRRAEERLQALTATCTRSMVEDGENDQ